MAVAERTVLDEVARRVTPVSLARERMVPVLAALEGVLPEGGLRQGSTVAVVGSTSLALALVARASAEGAWCAAVGAPTLGLAAAAEVGVALERFPLVAAPGRGEWATVVAALLDAVAAVLAWPPPHLREADARRLAARARERGAVLLVCGGGWPVRADLTVRVVRSRWEGLGEGHGHLRARLLEIAVSGRGAAGRERRGRLWLPAAGGGVAPAATDADVEPAVVRAAETG